MAENIAAEIVKTVLAKLASEGMKRYVRSQGIHSELKNLERTLFQIQNLLTDASRKEIADTSVKEWLLSLQHLAYDIDDILDDLATEAMRREFNEESDIMTSHVRKLIPTCCSNFALDHRMRHKLDNMTNKFQNLEKEKNMLGLNVKNEKPIKMNRKPETSMLDEPSIVGRQGEKKELVAKLLLVEPEPRDQNFTIVPIVGMGGVGKTTLARLLYNEKQVKDHFELTAWVCVSDVIDYLHISKVIFQSVTGENKDFADLNLLQEALRDQLSSKRFLLVLDDVWTESYEDWNILVGPFHGCALGSKIIMTTRKDHLLKKLGCDRLNPLQSMTHDDAICLFAQNALGVGNFDSHPTLEPLGEGIVEKCDGLPLALISIGRLLRTRKDVEYWNEVLNSEVWMLKDGGGIVPALRLSYQDLSANLKQLFAYCSLFPKDYVFDKEQLVLLWMAEGFLDQSSSSNSTKEQLGHEYFDELLSRSFFQHVPNNESLFVMHDLLNDLATTVAGDFFIRLENDVKNNIKKETLEKYRHMSFVSKRYEVYKKFEAFRRAKSLRTFLAVSIGVKERWERFFLSNKIMVDLLPELPLLRVLCLSSYQISEVPESISSLKHLRYLNLSQTGITHLPGNVGNLYNLETLILFGCHDLIKLPNTFIKLKNLRHFDIRDTPSLDKIPLGIGELKNLQTLSKILIGGENGFKITELKDLKNLCGKISIKGLDKVEDKSHAREMNFLQKSLTELEVEWSDVFDDSRKETLEKEVLKELKPHNDSLKQLKIVSYGGTSLPKWVGDPSFLRLKHVTIRGCKKCISLPPLGQLDTLKELLIEGLDGVKSVGSELLGSGGSFRSLEILSFKDMQGWKQWSSNGQVVFPCLGELSINKCPNLDVISLEALPSLRVLNIKACGNGVLRSLVQVASQVTELEIYDISGLTDEVWGGVMKCLRGVEELRISRSNEIRYLWESEAEASMVLVNLRMLEVEYCSNLVRLGEKEDDNGGSNLMILTSLRIFLCENMESCKCPNNIETLYIILCNSMTSVSFPVGVGGGQKLKSFLINGCKKLSESGVLVNNTRMPMLERIRIIDLVNLKSIIELNCYLHLTNLEIIKCESLESFPDHHFSNLASLKYLTLTDCPTMDAAFPGSGVVWPPNLQMLEIGGLNKPMSEWGPQNFPTSLVQLSLHGSEREDDVIDFCQLSHLLPSSLTSLELLGFKKVERVSKGLQHLTSLQHLDIYYCPEMMDLPEMLLSSLLTLSISYCSKLKERCKRSGTGYWPLISHIPSYNNI